jgi:hypothetical protein
MAPGTSRSAEQNVMSIKGNLGVGCRAAEGAQTLVLAFTEARRISPPLSPPDIRIAGPTPGFGKTGDKAFARIRGKYHE